MERYNIYIGGNEFTISGTQAIAYEFYEAALKFGRLLEVYVMLVDLSTGEVLADNLDEV